MRLEVVMLLCLLLLTGFQIMGEMDRRCEGCRYRSTNYVYEPFSAGMYGSWWWSSNGVLMICNSTQCDGMSKIDVGSKLVVDGKLYREDERLFLEVERVEMAVNKDIWGWFVSWFYQIRMEISKTYKTYLSEPYASLLTGIVLGLGQDFDSELSEDLKSTGTIHVVAASGFNIAVVATSALYISLMVLPRSQALVLSWLSIGGYVLLAGASSAVVRAGLMGSLMVLSQLTGRSYEASRALAAAAVFMILVNPGVIYDVGFQLSLAATAGILWWYPRMFWYVQRWSGEGGWRRLMAQDLTVSLVASLATLPIILFVFGRVSWISPVVNAAVLWMVPPLMALGGVLALVGWLHPVLGTLVAVPAQLLGIGFVFVVQWSAELPGVQVVLEKLEWWMMPILWLLIHWLVMKIGRNDKEYHA